LLLVAVRVVTDVFMDNANAEVSHLLNNFESTEGVGHPKIWRNVGAAWPRRWHA